MTYQSIETLRTVIDDLDMQIVTLLSRRCEIVSRAAKFKDTPEAVRDNERVEQIIKNVRTRAMARGLCPDLVETVYRVIIEQSIAVELRELYEGQK